MDIPKIGWQVHTSRIREPATGIEGVWSEKEKSLVSWVAREAARLRLEVKSFPILVIIMIIITIIKHDHTHSLTQRNILLFLLFYHPHWPQKETYCWKVDGGERKRLRENGRKKDRKKEWEWAHISDLSITADCRQCNRVFRGNDRGIYFKGVSQKDRHEWWWKYESDHSYHRPHFRQKLGQPQRVSIKHCQTRLRPVFKFIKFQLISKLDWGEQIFGVHSHTHLSLSFSGTHSGSTSILITD